MYICTYVHMYICTYVVHAYHLSGTFDGDFNFLESPN